MWISLKNIGKIASARIEIEGITVVAGINGTGKSTVGKALFSYFNGLHNYETKMRIDREKSIEALLDYLFRDDTFESASDTEEISKTIINEYKTKGSFTEEDLKRIFISENIIIDDKADNATIDLAEIVIRIQKILNVTDQEQLYTVIKKEIDEEFSGQCCSIYTDEDSEIAIGVKDQTTRIVFDERQIKKIDNPINFRTEVIYLDDPFVVDDNYRILARNYYYDRFAVNHRQHLKKKITKQTTQSVTQEIATQHGFNTIYQHVSSVCNGEIIINSRSSFGYKGADAKGIIDVHNVSTGMKTFMILKTLLMNGSLEYNGSIVLDEPEIHLHPEWQLIFAELIVLLQKEFHMNIIMNTHSPYFLRAIEVYSAYHKIANVCKYYLSENDGQFAKITDVTNDTERIYEKLSSPLQKLEDLRWEDD